MRRLAEMLKLLIGGAIAALALGLAACGGSSSASEEALQHTSDLYAIDQIEKNFHQAFSKKDIDLMMSLWSRNANFTVGPGKTLTNKKQIRQFWLKSKAFKPENHWVSDHPAYKLRSTANGDRGTLNFECHFIDVKTKKVVAVVGADMDVARIDGRWLITSMVGGSPTLSP
jgi:ketosteroid isomerase-like protein